jgi:hypothetical protein
VGNETSARFRSSCCCQVFKGAELGCGGEGREDCHVVTGEEERVREGAYADGEGGRQCGGVRRGELGGFDAEERRVLRGERRSHAVAVAIRYST